MVFNTPKGAAVHLGFLLDKYSEPFLLFDFLCGTLPSCLKVMGWGGVVAYEILVSAQDPLVLGFWVLPLRVWGLAWA